MRVYKIMIAFCALLMACALSVYSLESEFFVLLLAVPFLLVIPLALLIEGFADAISKRLENI